MKKKTNIKQIREAIVANRGGFATATDEQIRAIWDVLDDETQTQYIETVKPQKDKQCH